MKAKLRKDFIVIFDLQLTFSLYAHVVYFTHLLSHSHDHTLIPILVNVTPLKSPGHPCYRWTGETALPAWWALQHAVSHHGARTCGPECSEPVSPSGAGKETALISSFFCFLSHCSTTSFFYQGTDIIFNSLLTIDFNISANMCLCMCELFISQITVSRCSDTNRWSPHLLWLVNNI